MAYLFEYHPYGLLATFNTVLFAYSIQFDWKKQNRIVGTPEDSYIYIYKYININIYIDGADHKKQSMWWDAKQGLHGVECHNVNQVR